MTFNANHGPCCKCEQPVDGAGIFIEIDRECALPGRGWGCTRCGLPRNGAYVVFCRTCAEPIVKALETWTLEHANFVCQGDPARDGRIPIAEASKMFSHDMSKHTIKVTKRPT